jgi:hypothetical protein
MIKSNKFTVFVITLKIILFCVVFNLFGEYIISRDIPGFFQLLATIVMLAFMAIIFESIYKNLKTISTGVRN